MKKSNEKYRVVIIDDEPHVLEGLKNMINWEGYNYKLVNSFSQSDCALEFILNNEVDLVITDIRMPVIDGLEIVKAIKKNYLNTKVLMMSGYRNFEYVKKAMEYGASKYLVKPIFEEDICTTLNELAIVFENEKKENLYLESFHEESLKLFLNEPLDNHNFLSLEKFYKEVFDEHNWYVLTLWKGCKGIDQVVRLEVLNAFDESYQFIELFHQQHGAIFLVCCNPLHMEDRIKNTTSISKWQFSKKISALLLLRDEYLKSIENISRYHHLDENIGTIDHNIFNDDEWNNKVIDSLNRLDKESLQNLLKNYFDFYRREKLSARILLQGIMEQYSKITHSYSNLLSEINHDKKKYLFQLDLERLTYEVILVFIEERFEYLMGIINAMQKSSKDSFKCLIEEYILIHYSEELTIKELADYVHMHPTYLGQKLKNIFGESFSSYLNRVRIDKSNELIRNSSNTHIKEIACKVGYRQYHVFLKYFKKYNKKTPKEFFK